MFGLLVADEAHHCTSESYDDIFAHFKKNPNLKILGLTATPNRADEEALGKVFTSVSGPYDIEDAIKDGYLVSVRGVQIQAGCLDYSHVKTTAGDLNQGDLAEVMEAEEPVQRVAQATYEAIYGLPPGALSAFPPTEWAAQTCERSHKKTLVFCVRVVHSELLAAVLNRIEPGCANSMDGTTPHPDRKRFLNEFRSGKVKCLCNVGVFTEGFDEPGIENIIMARPTKSQPMFIQMLGRATRTLTGLIDGLETVEERLDAIAHSAKPFATVYDFTGNTGKHKIVRTVDALSGNYDEKEIAAATSEMAQLEKEGKSADVLELLRKKRLEIQKQKEERLRRQEAERGRIVAKTSYSVRAIDLFNVLDVTPHREFGWDADKRLSAKQEALLAKQGVDASQIPYAQGKQLINEMFRRWNNKLCTFKQAKLLKKHGFDTKEMPMSEASRLITALASNGWRRTPDMVAKPATAPVLEDVPF